MHKYILAIITTFCLITSNAFAGSFGMGVAGTMASVSAEGSESEDTNTGTDNSVRDATAGNEFVLGSVYAEYSFGDSDAKEAQQQDGKRTANAELSEHITYYAELGKMNGIYGKVGFAQVDVETKDTETHAGTSGLYPDKTLDAWTYALGYKGEFGERGIFKIEGFFTDYDGYSATNNSGKTSTKTVKADLDVVGASLRVGIKF